ncbi:CbtA family protein [Natronomonas sp. EA1]|uniref:CbtA family protein n=1 Tax=Natronomonas sp. EA1 TaxID=3421655 RepID=UPI003EBFBDCA
MLTRYLVRGLKAGTIGGIVFGLFVALVGNPLIGYAETFEHGHGSGPVVPGVVTTVVSILGGILLGVLVGVVVFGVAFYVLEPAIPGVGETKSYLLAAAGFLTVSGAPWLVVPPQPPGVEQTLPTDVRLLWYLLMMVAGAVTCGLSGYTYTRIRTRYGREVAAIGAVAVLGLLPVVAVFAPANAASGPIPTDLAAVFRTVTAVGQLGLWFVLASAHAWLHDRDRAAAPDLMAADAHGSSLAD